MLFKVKCSHCGVAIAAPVEKAGQRCKCPKCGQAFQLPAVPGASTASESPSTSGSSFNIPLEDLASPTDLRNANVGAGSLGGFGGPIGSAPVDPLGVGSYSHRSAGVETWVWVVMGTGAALILLLIGLVAGMSSNRHEPEVIAQTPAPPVAPAEPATAAPAPAPTAPKPNVLFSPGSPPPPPGPKTIRSATTVVSTSKARPDLGNENVVRSSTPAAPQERKSTADIIEGVQDGVVLITVMNSAGKELGLGTGFVVDSTGLVATNFHVMEDAEQARAQFHDGQSFEISGFRAFDRKRDLALVELKDRPANMRVLPLDLKRLPRVGSDVIAVGHPSGFKFTVTTGIVSGIHTTAQLPADVRDFLSAPSDNVWIQTNAAISGGNSGGPLLNSMGEVVGINSWIYTANGQTLGFATHVRNLADLQGKAHAELIPLAKVHTESKSTEFLANPDPQIAQALVEFKQSYTLFEQDLRQLMSQGSTRQQLAQLYATRNPVPIFVKRLMELSVAKPKTPVAFQALAIVCSLAAMPNAYPAGTLKRASEALIADHLSEPELGALMIHMAKVEDKAAPEFMKRVLEESPDSSIRGMACLARAMVLYNNEKLRARNEPEAIALLERVSQEFANVKYRTRTLGAIARPMLVEIKHLAVGKEAPEIVGKDIDGKEFKLSDYRGKVVVVDFFADWCPYCAQMYSEERALVDTLKDKPFALVGVNVDQRSRLLRLVTDQQVTWRCWSDGPKGPIAEGWNVSSFPCIYVLDAKGIVRYKFRGVPGPALAEAINTLLGGGKTDAKELAGAMGAGDVNSQFDALAKAADTQPMDVIVMAGMMLAESPTAKVSKKHLGMIEEWINKGLTADAESYDLKYALGRIREKQGRVVDAEKIFRALLLVPDVDEDKMLHVKHNLAYLLATGGDSRKDAEAAYLLIQEVIEKQGTSAELLDTRGMVFLALRNTQRALEDLRNVVAEKPLAITYFHLAQAELQGQSRQSAFDYIKMAFDNGLDPAQLTPQEQKRLEQMSRILDFRYVK